MLENNTHRSRLKATVEINMTPLMDLTFMLLIVFVITVPVLDYSTDVKLTAPQMKTPNEIHNTKDTLMVEIDKDGNCSVNDLPATFATLEDTFASFTNSNPDIQKVMIYADRSRPYEDIIAVMRAAQHANLKIAFRTEEEKKPRKK